VSSNYLSSRVKRGTLVSLAPSSAQCLNEIDGCRSASSATMGPLPKSGITPIALPSLPKMFLGGCCEDWLYVCVAAMAADPFWKEPTTLPNGQVNSHGLRVKIDKRPERRHGPIERVFRSTGWIRVSVTFWSCLAQMSNQSSPWGLQSVSRPSAVLPPAF
jgi:hypothetical protein